VTLFIAERGSVGIEAIDVDLNAGEQGSAAPLGACRLPLAACRLPIVQGAGVETRRQSLDLNPVWPRLSRPAFRQPRIRCAGHARWLSQP